MAFLVGIFLHYDSQLFGKRPDGWLLFYALVFVSAVPIGILFYRYNFEVNRWKDSDYSPYATDD